MLRTEKFEVYEKVRSILKFMFYILSLSLNHRVLISMYDVLLNI